MSSTPHEATLPSAATARADTERADTERADTHRPGQGRVDLRRFAWLSIAAAVATIALKMAAWRITGSVGLLSDAAESVVNLVAAVVALWALTVAARPASRKHNFGTTKAEYFSAAIEGGMILVAAVVIIWTAVQRFLHPQPLESVGIGLAVSVVASVLNGAVAWVLMRAGRRHSSVTLTADGKHLLTDVWTTVGVIIGVLLVPLTGWTRLDALIAFAVGVNIIVTGVHLMRESADGLLDVSLPEEENAQIKAVLARHEVPGQITFHEMRTRQAGHRKFMEVHVLVPGSWTVQKAHDFAEDLTDQLGVELPDLTVTTHLEPVEDPRSYETPEF